MLRPSIFDRRDQIITGLRHALTLFAFAVALVMTAPVDASAQCGGQNEPPCTRTECILHGFFGNCLASKTIRTCDTNRLNLRLTLDGFRCQACGGLNEAACDTGASCSAAGTVNLLGTCRACGDAGQVACSGGCNEGNRSILGLCTPCGDVGELVCEGNTCNPDRVGVSGICRACGDAGEPRCADGCNAGTVDLLGLGTCRACGGAAQPACGNGSCDPGRRNVLGICVPCGGAFQRACDTTPACDSGLTHIGGLADGRCVPFECGGNLQPKCAVEPVCDDRHQPVQDVLSADFGLCVACGGSLQPQCRTGPACDEFHNASSGLCFPCGGNLQNKCQEGPECQARHQSIFDELSSPDGFCVACGGAGQPFCRTLDPGCDRPRTNVLGLCVDTNAVDEPTCNCTVPEPGATPGQPIWGFADLHAHQFANLGFGGAAFVGAPFDPYGIEHALPACGFTVDFPTVLPDGTRTDTDALTGVPVHGALHANDPFGFLAGNPALLSNFGSSRTGLGHGLSFEGWPLWKSPDHQRMYYTWLERAWRGGLRLMIVQAVNNELNCGLAPRRVDTQTDASFGCSDMAAVDRQIQAAKDLETFIDEQAGGPGQGWYRIVYSPAQARAAMAAGKLAVVLGIEVDNLFDCRDGLCNEAHVDAQLRKYYNLGVRHAYPIHIFDNDFGGASYYFEAFNAGNRILNGEFFQTYDCSAQGFEFRRAASDQQDAITNFLTAYFAANLGIVLPPWVPTANGADCNARGLTPLGKFLVRRMMDRGMIVDVDHLSFRAVNDVLTIGEEKSYPVIASHSSAADMHSGENRGERKWTVQQLRRLRDLGGIAAPILIPDPTNEYLRDGAPVVANDCPSSSKEWAQRYLKLVELMSGGPYPVGVGYGSDFNGMTKGLAPRYGGDVPPGARAGCVRRGGRAAAGRGSAGAVSVHRAGRHGTFDKQVTGGKTFDYNVDGLAHVGLVPDFIQDLKKVGLSDADLEPFFRSAEAFLQMWERIGARGAPPPTTTVTITPPPNEAGWHRTSVQVRVDAIGQLDGPSVAAVAVSATGADAREPAQTPGSATQVTIDAEGTTVLQLGGVDTEGNQEPEQAVTIRIDRVPPEVSPLVTPPPNDSGWHRGDVTVSLLGADEQSGVANCDGPFVVTGEGTNFSATGGCTDVAGNVGAVIEVSGINIDRTAPLLTAPNAVSFETTVASTPIAGNEALAGFLSAASAEDALDPSPDIRHDAPLELGLGTTTVTFVATDKAGNAAEAATTVTMRGRPTFSWAPAVIVAGIPIGGGQLNAAASFAGNTLDGTFAYSVPAGTVLGAGQHLLTATFTPADPLRYVDGSVTATLTVEPPPPVTTALFLDGGGGANPPVTFLDSAAPTVAAPQYKDSPGVKFGNGNPWAPVGSWTTTSALPEGALTSLSNLRIWLGLKNSDDQGTRFDVRAEVRRNGVLVASGESRCIQGVTRTPGLAKEVSIPFNPFGSVPPDGPNTLSLSVYTRIGTDGAGAFCGGHSNAVGLRLYFDAADRPARFDATVQP